MIDVERREAAVQAAIKDFRRTMDPETSPNEKRLVEHDITQTIRRAWENGTKQGVVTVHKLPGPGVTRYSRVSVRAAAMIPSPSLPQSAPVRPLPPADPREEKVALAFRTIRDDHRFYLLSAEAKRQLMSEVAANVRGGGDGGASSEVVERYAKRYAKREMGEVAALLEKMAKRSAISGDASLEERSAAGPSYDQAAEQAKHTTFRTGEKVYQGVPVPNGKGGWAVGCPPLDHSSEGE